MYFRVHESGRFKFDSSSLLFGTDCRQCAEFYNHSSCRGYGAVKKGDRRSITLCISSTDCMGT